MKFILEEDTGFKEFSPITPGIYSFEVVEATDVRASSCIFVPS